MKIVLTILLLIFSFSRDVLAQDSLTIVAVGEAESENEKIAFLQPEFTSSLSFGEKNVMSQVIKLFQSDFSFYKNLFQPVENLLSREKIPDYSSWKNSGYRYIVDSVFSKTDQKINLNFTLYDVQLEKMLLKETSFIDIQNYRKDGHQIADKIYFQITGKKSIFNTKILFVSDRTSQGSNIRKEIYIMDFDGERKQRLTYSNSMIISPSLSPDNTKILYSIIESKWKKSSRGNIQKVKNINLYLYNLVTKEKTLISELDGINSGAIFSADGQSIYLTLSNQKNADIFKMDLKSKKTTRITNHFLDDVDPHINATGDLMTFLSGRSGKAMIYTMDPRGQEKDIKRISFVGRFNAAPRFSADGKEIVFSSWVDGRFDLYKIDSNGNNLVRLTKNFGSNEEPWFSPDGQFIVFTSQRVLSRTHAVQDLYIMNREGEIIKKISDLYGKCYTPRWSN